MRRYKLAGLALTILSDFTKSTSPIVIIRSVLVSHLTAWFTPAILSAVLEACVPVRPDDSVVQPCAVNVPHTVLSVWPIVISDRQAVKQNPTWICDMQRRYNKTTLWGCLGSYALNNCNLVQSIIATPQVCDTEARVPYTAVCWYL